MANQKGHKRHNPSLNLDFQSYKIGPSMKERMGLGSSNDDGTGFFIAFILFIVAAIVGIIVSLSMK